MFSVFHDTSKEDGEGHFERNGVAFGTTVAGQFTYDPSATGAAGRFGGTEYSTGSIDASFENFSVSFGQSEGTTVLVQDSGAGATDSFSLRGFTSGAGVLSGFSFELGEEDVYFGRPYGQVGFALNLFDDTGTVFSDETLPTALSLSDFDRGFFTLDGITSESDETGPDVVNRLEARITSLSTQPPAPVPLPASALLLGGGLLAGFGALRGRRNRHDRSV